MDVRTVQNALRYQYSRRFCRPMYFLRPLMNSLSSTKVLHGTFLWVKFTQLHVGDNVIDVFLAPAFDPIERTRFLFASTYEPSLYITTRNLSHRSRGTKIYSISLTRFHNFCRYDFAATIYSVMLNSLSPSLMTVLWNKIKKMKSDG